MSRLGSRSNRLWRDIPEKSGVWRSARVDFFAFEVVFAATDATSRKPKLISRFGDIVETGLDEKANVRN